MNPPAIALVLYLSYLAITFGLRAWLLYRHTGTTGFRGLSGPAWSARWWGGVLFVVALVAGLVAPVMQVTGFITPVAAFDAAPVHVAGAILALSGTAATLIAQQTMRQAWRVGVDEAETTELVRTGVFATVRNPVFTAVLLTAAGLASLNPNVVALSALAALFIAIELQVRTVEEPYLLTAHGDAYKDYTRAVGRFLPGVGRRAV